MERKVTLRSRDDLLLLNRPPFGLLDRLQPFFYQATIPLAKIWGGGEVASADGLRFATPIRTIDSGPNPKYFGFARGVTYYNFTYESGIAKAKRISWVHWALSPMLWFYGTRFIPKLFTSSLRWTAIKLMTTILSAYRLCSMDTSMYWADIRLLLLSLSQRGNYVL